jgi:hypothetical protein
MAGQSDRNEIPLAGNAEPWVALVAAFFHEPTLTRTGAAWRLVLAGAAAAALTAVLLLEIAHGSSR